MVGIACDMALAIPRLDQGQSHQDHRTVVGRDPVVPFGSASTAAMQNHLFPIRPVKRADGRHQRFALAFAIARVGSIDMARIEAERTMVPMLASTDGWPHKRAAMPAFERFAAIGRALWFGNGAICPLPAPNPFMVGEFACSPIFEVHLWHVEVLLCRHSGPKTRETTGSTRQAFATCISPFRTAKTRDIRGS